MKHVDDLLLISAKNLKEKYKSKPDAEREKANKELDQLIKKLKKG